MSDPQRLVLGGPGPTAQQRREVIELAGRAFLAAHRAHPCFSPWPLIIALYTIAMGAGAGLVAGVVGCGAVASLAVGAATCLVVVAPLTLLGWSIKHGQLRRDLAAAQRIEVRHAGGAIAVAAFSVDWDAGAVPLHLVAAHAASAGSVTAALRTLRPLLDEADQHELTVHTHAANRRLAVTYQRLYGFVVPPRRPVWSSRRYWNIPIHRPPGSGGHPRPLR